MTYIAIEKKRAESLLNYLRQVVADGYTAEGRTPQKRLYSIPAEEIGADGLNQHAPTPPEGWALYKIDASEARVMRRIDYRLFRNRKPGIMLWDAGMWK